MLVQNIGHDCSNITSETVMTLHWEIQNSSFEKQRAYLPDNQSFLSGRHLIVTNNMSETIIDIKFICTQWAKYPAIRSNGPLPQVITRPSYQIEKFAFTALVEFRVEDFGNLVFNVVVNFNRRWWGLYSVRDRVRSREF